MFNPGDRGRRKANIVAEQCRMELDIRVPLKVLDDLKKGIAAMPLTPDTRDGCRRIDTDPLTADRPDGLPQWSGSTAGGGAAPPVGGKRREAPPHGGFDVATGRGDHDVARG